MALALVALGAGALRRPSANFSDVPPGAVQASSGGALEEQAPTRRGDETASGAAVLASRYESDLASALARLSARGGELTAGDLLGLREIEARRDRITEELRNRLREDPASWPEVIDALGRLADGSSAKKTLEKLRDQHGPGASASAEQLLRPDLPSSVKRLSIAALVFQDDERVLSTLAQVAQEDPDPALRQDALRSLADRRGRLLARGISSPLIEDTLRRESAADPDPLTRECARELAGAPPVLARPVTPPPQRFSRAFPGRGM